MYKIKMITGGDPYKLYSKNRKKWNKINIASETGR